MNALDKLRAEFRLLGYSSYYRRYYWSSVPHTLFKVSYFGPDYGPIVGPRTLREIPILESVGCYNFKILSKRVDLNKTYDLNTGNLRRAK